MAENQKVDIWVEGIKAIVGAAKRSLLDYIDLIDAKTPTEKENLGKIKGRVHNDLSSVYLNIGTLFTALRNGGDITPFQDAIIKSKGTNTEK